MCLLSWVTVSALVRICAPIRYYLYVYHLQERYRFSKLAWHKSFVNMLKTKVCPSMLNFVKLNIIILNII